ncbi:MAG: type 12 methyltransferase [Limisphaerales bacterium]|nr:MAG: type 12 methyltransferase [Limisphaerales bacterium]KAG0510131.1 MAG: type 12 methyltransferase [Limisphaerales bacterium]TXT52974.1 MAG: type 12 methyltransferase [Limisphaerales bacterium]
MTPPPNAAAANTSFEFAALAEAVNYRHALLREFAPHLRGDVLEVGAGIGQFTELLAGVPAVQRVHAVEPEAELARRFRERLPAVPLTSGTIADFGAQAVDGIVTVNVLEHIEDDAEELQRYAARLRERRGRLCLFVPARPEIYAPIDRDFGHFRRYTRAELAGKLRAAGFSVTRLDYFNALGYVAWWASFCVLRRRSFDVASVRFYDRVLFPPVHFLESRLCRPPVGQSLIAVAQA